MNRCPACTQSIRTAHVVCRGCGKVLPLQVVVVSEGSQGGGFALVQDVNEKHSADLPEVRSRCEHKEAAYGDT